MPYRLLKIIIGNKLKLHPDGGILPKDTVLSAFCASQQQATVIKMNIGFNKSSKHYHVGQTEQK